MEKINHKKIAVKTLLIVLFALLFILIFNSWGNIRQLYNGNNPPFSVWIANSFKAKNLILLIFYGAYFYYRNYMMQRRSVLKQKVVAEQNEMWDKAQ